MNNRPLKQIFKSCVLRKREKAQWLRALDAPPKYLSAFPNTHSSSSQLPVIQRDPPKHLPSCTHTHTNKFFKKSFKSCVLASSTMVVYQQQVQESSSCSVREAGCLSWSSAVHWNPEEVGSNASKGMDLIMRGKASRQREQASFFMFFT